MALEKVNKDVNEPVEKKVVERKEEKVTDISAPSISLEQVRELLAEQAKQFEKKIEDLKTNAPTNKDINGTVATSVDDYMDEPATFFVFATAYSIFGDKVRGIETTPPNGQIKFSNVLRTRQRTSNGEKIISISSHVTNSRAVAEWLRNCSAFGYEIFEDMNTVKNIDAAWAQQLVASSNIVNNFSDHAVISRCKQEGIPISTDLTDLRRKLTTLIAKQNEQQHKDLLEKKLRAANIEENRIVTNGTVNI